MTKSIIPFALLLAGLRVLSYYGASYLVAGGKTQGAQALALQGLNVGLVFDLFTLVISGVIYCYWITDKNKAKATKKRPTAKKKRTTRKKSPQLFIFNAVTQKYEAVN